MDLHLTTDPTARPPHVRVFVDGALVAELAAGVCQDRDALAAEVTRARALEALAMFVRRWQADLEAVTRGPDHVNTSFATRKAAFALGLEDGLAGRTAPHPSGPLVLAAAPEHSASYRRGFEHGAALRRALTLIEET